MAVIHSPLGNDARDECADALQKTLADVLALTDVVRHASWAVVGNQSMDSRALLSELGRTLSGNAVALARRMAAIGVPPDGRTAPAVENSEVDTLADGWIEVSDAVSAVIEGISVCVVNARGELSRVSEFDPVSAHVLLSVVADLEAESWQWQAAGVSWISRGRHGS